MESNKAQFEKAAEKITPPVQGPLNQGEKAQPKHTQAAPLTPMGT